MAHTRQSRPDSGLGFQVKVLKMFQVVLGVVCRGELYMNILLKTVILRVPVLSFMSSNKYSGEAIDLFWASGFRYPLPSEIEPT